MMSCAAHPRKVRSDEAVSKLEMRALQGRYRTAQGASPGNREQTKTEPCKGGAEACTAPAGLSCRAWSIPGLTPRAVLHGPLQGRRRQVTREGWFWRQSRWTGPPSYRSMNAGSKRHEIYAGEALRQAHAGTSRQPCQIFYAQSFSRFHLCSHSCPLRTCE